MYHISIRQIKAAEIKIFAGTIRPDQTHIQVVLTDIVIVGGFALNAPPDQNPVSMYAEPAAGDIRIVLGQVAACLFSIRNRESSVRLGLRL